MWSLNFPQRCYILAWTSLWIFLPAILFDVSWLDFVLLLLSGVFSIAHWTNNNTGDWRHIGDISIAVCLAASLIYRLIKTTRIVACIGLGGAFGAFFALQRFAQARRSLDWGFVTVLHLLFRYIGFWLAMTALAPANWNSISKWGGLTFLYWLHILWLHHRVKS